MNFLNHRYAKYFWLLALSVASLPIAGGVAYAKELIDVTGMYPNLDFRMEDVRSGTEVAPPDYRGKVVVLLFGYTTCPDVCPTELATLSSVIDRSTDLRDQISILFVTVDPNRDTPAVLKQFVEAFSPGVTGLRGTPNELALLARRYRASYTVRPSDKPENYKVDHTATVLIFDRKGQIRFLGPNGTSEADFEHDLRLLVRETSSQ